MRRLLAIAAFLFLLASITSPAAAEPLSSEQYVAPPPSPIVLASLTTDDPVTRGHAGVAGKFDYRIIRQPAPMSTPILLAGRCGSSNFRCDPPTPYCCGTGPSNYYCAKDVNGCTR
jgi:hypothetical protein